MEEFGQIQLFLIVVPILGQPPRAWFAGKTI